MTNFETNPNHDHWQNRPTKVACGVPASVGCVSSHNEFLDHLRAICIKIVMALICLFLGFAGILIFIVTRLAKLFRRSLWS